MASQYDHRSAFQFLKSKHSGSWSNSRVVRPSNPPSETTEILDTDFDSESDVPYDSPRRSFGTESVTTASTPDQCELKTPVSAGLSGFHFHIDEKPMRGPEGPFLFQSQNNLYRLSDGSMDIKSTVEIDLILDDAPDSATTPLYSSASKLGPDYRRDTPVPRVANPSTPLQSVPENISSQPNEALVASWTPQDVVAWMQSISIDDGIIEKFFINDISGSVLLDLQPDDLKELDIQSFGKRHGVMTSIRQLRNSISGESFDSPFSIPSEPVSREPTPGSTAAEVGVRSCNATPVNDDEHPPSPSKDLDQYHQHRRQRRQRQRVVGPNDSISIVGIEQVLPKIHRCSKGEDCRKWQRQQAKLSQYTQGLPVDSVGSPVIVAGDPGNAATAPNMVKSPKSDITPSLIASSDALGPNQQPAEVPISAKALQDVRPRDAQENVRHFIKLQRLSQLQPVENPSTPPRETFPSPEADSPRKLAEKLQKLPTLQIPNEHIVSARSSRFSPSLSGQRTVTPSVMRRRQPFQQPNQEQVPTPYGSLFSPSDYYRQDPSYGYTSQTPVSEVDVPLTAIPIGPVERVFSQSVPPDMRFGHEGQEEVDPIARPISTKVENHRRKLSANAAGTALGRLEEGRAMSPIETPADLERTPRAAHCRINPFTPAGELSRDIIHSGWVKKRKTKNLVRHEWTPKYCALRNTQRGDERGTELAVYSDQSEAEGDSKAIEYIDVDDYAVACSSLASNSKLTAAFKKTVLKRKDNTRGDTAFAFSLIPSPDVTSAVDRKTVFQNSKSHHFAVNTRDERIDWMRELMLARALRRGRESGASLNLNGNAVF
ncbi:hypothetical protein N7476_007584 [Penicillium atrosanguineum]|uniref:SAM and PH domain protein n=1 Tax=Penicillium atrosanguineum TaxID=1132637 RepID=A0A9W9U435_9EURO|nr:hypothetical protein N7476_007584 [Penicillium atrosanguineum]